MKSASFAGFAEIRGYVHALEQTFILLMSHITEILMTFWVRNVKNNCFPNLDEFRTGRLYSHFIHLRKRSEERIRMYPIQVNIEINQLDISLFGNHYGVPNKNQDVKPTLSTVFKFV